jgi:hypothetical protein
VRPKAFNALPPAKLRFIEPMYALPFKTYRWANEWLYEVKFDESDVLPGM